MSSQWRWALEAQPVVESFAQEGVRDASTLFFLDHGYCFESAREPRAESWIGKRASKGTNGRRIAMIDRNERCFDAGTRSAGPFFRTIAYWLVV
jgi:hypothetical protein